MKPLGHLPGDGRLFRINTSRPIVFLFFLSASLAACGSLPGSEPPPATTAPTPTALAVDVATVSPTATPADSPEETPAPQNTPVVMETPVKTPRPRATPKETSFLEDTPEPTPKPAKTPKPTPTPKPTKTPKATPVVEATPETVDLALDTPAATPIETPADTTPPDAPAITAVKVASLSFKPGTDVHLLNVDVSATAGQSIVTVALSAAANYKILPLPNRREVWIDFEIPELPEPQTIAGSGASLVKQVSVRSFERGMVRVVVALKDDGKPFPVIGPKKRVGEAASVVVKIGPDPDPPP